MEKTKRQLEEEVSRGAKPEKTPSGLGADLQPVPEPTVRDLSVPQAKGPRLRKTTYPDAAKEPAPAEPAEAPAGKEPHVATTDEVLGRKSEAPTPESKPTEEADQAGEAGKDGAAKPGGTQIRAAQG